MVVANKQVIETEEELRSYIENLPEKTQLRFPAKTASSDEYGVCLLVWNQEQDTVVILPYIHKRSSKALKKNQKENPEILARLCLLSETGLDTDPDSYPKQIGSILEMGDLSLESSKDEKEKFSKYTMLITEFKGVLRTKVEVIDDKNREPVWIKRELLKHIFEAKFETEDGRVLDHPQKYAYDRFMDYYSREMEW